MQDILIIDDNASFSSSGDSSIFKYNGPGLRRRRTVQRLSRWLSKKVSRQHLVVDDDHKVAKEKEEDHDLYESYAAFCQAFTTSGHTGQNRGMKTESDRLSFDGDCPDESLARPTLCVGVNDDNNHNHNNNNTNHTTDPIPPISPASPPPSLLSDSRPSTHRDSTSSSSSTPQQDTVKQDTVETGVHPPSHTFTPPVPPPRVLTPSLYAQRRAIFRERKQLQRHRHRLWEPIRSWFAEMRGSRSTGSGWGGTQ